MCLGNDIRDKEWQQEEKEGSKECDEHAEREQDRCSERRIPRKTIGERSKESCRRCCKTI